MTLIWLAIWFVANNVRRAAARTRAAATSASSTTTPKEIQRTVPSTGRYSPAVFPNVWKPTAAAAAQPTANWIHVYRNARATMLLLIARHRDLEERCLLGRATACLLRS